MSDWWQFCSIKFDTDPDTEVGYKMLTVYVPVYVRINA